MKISYYIGNNVNVIDQFIKELIKNNISYVLITDKDYVEIHFLENIYRLYSKIVVSSKVIVDPFSSLYEELAFNNITKNFYDSEIIGFKYKKERLGFKKYTKKDIRRDSKNCLINKRAKSFIRYK